MDGNLCYMVEHQSLGIEPLRHQLSLQVFVDFVYCSFGVDLQHNTLLLVPCEDRLGIVREGFETLFDCLGIVIRSALSIEIPSARLGSAKQSLLHNLFGAFEVNHVADVNSRAYFFTPRLNVI